MPLRFVGPLQVAVLIVLLVSALPPAGFGGPAGALPAPRVVRHAAAPTSPVAPTPSALPGTDPTGEPTIDGPRLDARERAGPTSSPPTVANPGPISRNDTPLTPSSATGTVAGFVKSSSTGKPLPGANVTFASLLGLGCPGCAGYAVASSSGLFTLTVPVGPLQLTVDLTGYLENHTWVSGVANQTVAAGTIYLLRLGYVTGTVLMDLPGTPAAVGFSVLGTDRSGSLAGGPGATTDANGTFTVAVPPGQAMISLSPPSHPMGEDFEINRSYTAVASNATVDIGVVYVEGGSPAKVQLRDSVNGSTSVFHDVWTIVRLCNRYDDFCAGWVNPNSNGVATPLGVPGPSTLQILSAGYVVDKVPVYLPPRSTASPVDLGTVKIVPSGAIGLRTNITGAPPAQGPWPVAGSFQTEVCTASGVQVAAYPPQPIPQQIVPVSCVFGPGPSLGGGSINATAPPLRDMVYLVTCPTSPGGIPSGSFPVARAPLPLLSWGYLSPGYGCARGQWANETWANVTPGRLTDAGYANVTAGDYVTGNVTVIGTTSAAVVITVCSTDNPAVCTTGGIGTTGGAAAGCRNATNAFCVMSPPGPIRVNATVAGDNNATWAQAAVGCCGQDGRPLDVGTLRVDLGNATPFGWLNGSVRINSSGQLLLGPAPAAVEGCPVAPVVVVGPVCAETLTNATGGNFSLRVPQTWVQVNVSETGFGSNSTWIDVGSANTTGVIVLQPLVPVVGELVDPSGTGLVAGNVVICSMAISPLQIPCSGTPTQADTGGGFEVMSTPASFPEAAAELHASAGGFQDTWTWFNATPGAFIDLGKIVLTPTQARPAPRLPSGGQTVWVSGRLIDADSGLPLAQVPTEYCSLGTGCQFVGLSTDSGGGFNLSLPLGTYELFLNATAHYTVSASLNLTSGALALGTLRATAYPTLSGQVLIEPWRSLASSVAEGAGFVSIIACPNGASCLSGASTDSAGVFNVSVPEASQVVVKFQVSPQQFAGVIGAGFSANSTSLPVKAGANALSSPMGLEIDGSVTGEVLDSQSLNSTTGVADRGALFPIVSVETNSHVSGGGSFVAGPAGVYRLFLAGDYTSGRLFAALQAFLHVNTSLPTGIPAGATEAVAAVTLWHFGWLDIQLRDASTGQPIGGAFIVATLSDPVNGTALRGWEYTNSAGYANLTAPPGPDNVTATLLQTLLTNVTIAVSAMRTSSANLTNRTPVPSYRGLLFLSATVNTLGAPPWPGVNDGLTGAPLRLGSIAVTDLRGTAVGPISKVNRLGQFLVPGSWTDNASVRVFDQAFVTPASTFVVPPSSSGVVVAPIYASGRAVVAGTVEAEPGNLSVQGLEVSACPTSGPACLNFVTTNSSGGFWLYAGPGPTIISIQSDLYLANSTRVVNASSDRFYELGVIPVFRFGTLTGTVLGLPMGEAVAGANVSLCSRLGVPSGPCFTSVTTNSTGAWAIEAPAGTYILRVSAPDYNTSYLLVSVPSGVTQSLGVVFLVSFGELVGSVVSAATGQPLAGTLLTACPASSSIGCSTGLASGASAGFDFAAPPGPDILSIDATGYALTVLYIDVPSGRPLDLGPLALERNPPAVDVNLSGTVEDNSTGLPISSAFLRAEANGSVYGVATTSGNGSFVVEVPWGLYTLVASASGYHPARVAANGHLNLTGLLLRLDPARYTVTIRVTTSDGITGIGEVGVQFNGTLVGQTDSAGSFAVLEPNGSYSVTLVPPAGRTVQFSNRTVPVHVRGADISTTVELPYAGLPLLGQVIDYATGAGIASANITMSTASIASIQLRSAANGSFGVILPPATYQVNVSAPGYSAVSLTYALGPGSAPLLVTLGRPTPTTPPAALFGLEQIVLAAGVVVAASSLLVLWRRRRRSPSGEGEPTATESELYGMPPEP